MRLEPYRGVLALPGVRSLMVLALLARIPITAIGGTLTLHIVEDLQRGYGAAGLVAGALTVGAALGAPLNGRFVDRRGLRPMLVVTTLAEAAFWVVSPTLSYPTLLAGAFVAGLLALPVFSVVRQSIAALVPAEQRRPAYALDSMSVELSFMAGPPLAVLLFSMTSGTITMLAIGATLVVSGVSLFLTNPPVRPHDEKPHDGPPLKRREWLTPQLLAVFAAASATTLVLAGTDVAIIARLREVDRLPWVGAVLAAWGGYSMIGGFFYGALTRAVPLVPLLGGLSLLTVPIGLVGGHWGWLLLALLPAGVLCAPTLSATTDVVSRLVPPSARGEAMGWHGSSLTVGLAIGAPLAGWAMDSRASSWGFGVVGTAGVVVTLVLLAVRRRFGTTGPAGSEEPTATKPGAKGPDTERADAAPRSPSQPALHATVGRLAERSERAERAERA